MTVNASNDWIVQLHIKEITLKNKHLPTDFYWEQGKMVMTESYHKRRGSCCGNGCLNCPYEPKHKKESVIIK
jgi:hypothetical protein